MPIPLKTALIGETSGHEICPEQLIVFDQAQQSVTFDNVIEPPLLSINRNFSAPIIVQAERRAGELERLAQTDTDPFARYEAIQELMMRALVAGARGETADPGAVIDAIDATLKSNSLDRGVQGRSDPVAERKPDRRPRRRGRSRRHPRSRANGCAGRSVGAFRRAACGAPERRSSKATTCRPRKGRPAASHRRARPALGSR